MPGTVYVACDKEKHLVIEDDFAVMMKLIERDPIGGHRPSADMLFASVARAGVSAIGGLLAAQHEDGTRGLDALAKSGAKVFVQETDAVGPNERCEAVSKMGTDAEHVNAKDMGPWILDCVKK